MNDKDNYKISILVEEASWRYKLGHKTKITALTEAIEDLQKKSPDLNWTDESLMFKALMAL